MTGAGPTRSIGVTGTAVEDTIETADGVRVEDLGGITYAWAAFEALLPDGVSWVPILGVGADALDRVRADLAARGVSDAGLVRTEDVNNKVRLAYAPDGRRRETLTGGVGPLPWEALAPWPPRLDAWHWNLISGMEVERETFARVKAAGRPVYLDLHSLCLDHGRHGHRRFRRPPEWEAWVEGVGWLQLNADEAGLLARARPEPLEPDAEAALAERIHDLGVRGVLVTRGAGGARWYAADGTRREAPAEAVERAVDPTGCGDVFGAAWSALHLAHGQSPEAALAGAVRAAGIAATVRGTAPLTAALRARRDRILAAARPPTRPAEPRHGR